MTEHTTADIRQTLTDIQFVSGVLEGSSDCIKLLSLDGKLEFMSAGGQRVMEVDDIDALIGCAWPSFWPGEGGQLAQRAVDDAVAGKVAHFQGQAPTARGNGRWWEVTVSPVPGPDGRPAKILSISRDITARVEQDRMRDLLMREMQHRVMNTLAMVSAIANQSLRYAKDVDAARIAIASRIEAMRKANALLMESGVEKVSIADIARGSISAFDMPASRFSLAGAKVEVSARAALALSLVMNELSTNATKYGALSNDTGRVAIEWGLDRVTGDLTLTWTEEGGPVVVTPKGKGFGSRLIDQALAGSLGGSTKIDFDREGVSCIICVPLDRLTAD
jgi:two-component sensor histidine kinase